MGWFALACVFGFLLYWAGATRGRRRTFLAAACVLGVVAIIHAARSEQGLFAYAGSLSHRLGGDLARLIGAGGDGRAARWIFGGVLGFGFGYATLGRTGQDQRPPLAGPMQSAYMSIGLALVLLASVAPHLDRWLDRLSGFKSRLVEIELASISAAHKDVVPDTREGFMDTDVLQIVGGYSERIDEDSIYVKKILLPDAKARLGPNAADVARLEALHREIKEIKPAFEQVISPLAQCMQWAMEHGYSVGGARLAAIPLADALEQIIVLSDPDRAADKETPAELENARMRFKVLMIGLAQSMKIYWPKKDAPDCSRTLASDDFVQGRWQVPDIRKYRNLPYLYVAMAGLLSFVGDDDGALKTLEQASPLIKFHDYVFPYVEVRIMYFRGEPVANYRPVAEQMRDTAQERLDAIDRVASRCVPSPCDAALNTEITVLSKRARGAETLAINNVAYGIAQDISAGIDSAKELRPIAEDYAAQLARIVDHEADAIKSGEIKSRDDAQGIRDTIAFVSLVAEAAKPSPDTTELNKDIGIFKHALAYQRDLVSAERRKGELIDKRDLGVLRTYRAHLSSAQSLLGD